MTAFALFCLRFGLASLACLGAGLGIWLVAALCRRCLPALALQRSLWLLGQLAIALTFVLVLLPQTAPLRAVPAIELSRPSLAVAEGGDAEAEAFTARAGIDPAAGTAPPAAGGAPLLAAQAWLAVYLAGLLLALGRLWRSQYALRALLASGEALDDLAGHRGFADLAEASACAAARPAVIEVDAAISPMLLGLFKPRLLLPRHLRHFEAIEQQLIVAHELTHWRRRDLAWSAAALALQTLFWFHPVMRLLRQQLGWAQELACDHAVLAGRSAATRKAYAAALLAQFKTQQAPGMVLTFGGASTGRSTSMAARMALIRAARPLAASRATRVLALGALTAVFAINLALQPALALHPATASQPASASQQAQAGTGSANAATADALPVVPAALDCTEIIDAASGRVLAHDSDCAVRITPASTFNIAVSVMGFDSGFLRDAHHPLLPFRPGYIDWNRNWRQATDPSSWISNSTVWYAQQVTSTLGEARLAGYLDSFGYGNRDASGDPGRHNGLTASWISSSLQISAVEQVAFLSKLAKRQLPASDRAQAMTAQLLQLPSQDGWQVYGKTGTARAVLADGSEDREQSYGWFVGWASKDGRTLVFARLLQSATRSDSVEGAAGPRLKRAFLRGLPARLAALDQPD